ncbi:MAG TPA: hypothetical protein VK731_06995 [Candidatus Cybelea sp.]|nr:hypothetical protein [Candidatus Cybelea sp.]
MKGANLAWRSGVGVAGGGFPGVGAVGDKGEVDGGVADGEAGDEDEREFPDESLPGVVELVPEEPERATGKPESPGPGVGPDSGAIDGGPLEFTPTPPPPVPCSPAMPGPPAEVLPATPLLNAVRCPRSPKTMLRAGSSGLWKSQTNSAITANTNIATTMSMPVMRARTGSTTVDSQAGQTVPALSPRAWKLFPHRVQTCSIYLTPASFAGERALLAD